MAAYPRRLIEVDLPIKRISAHARREKSIRHRYIRALHANRFHAKDDLPEVRREVFALLRRHPLRFLAVVRDKQKLEDRYLQYVWPLVRLVHDVDDTRTAQYGVYYTQKKPLTLAALEGLPGDIGFFNRS
jgi:hypothetical protein